MSKEYVCHCPLCERLHNDTPCYCPTCMLEYRETIDKLNELPAQANAFAKEFMGYAVNVVDKVIMVEMAKINAMIEEGLESK